MKKVFLTLIFMLICMVAFAEEIAPEADAPVATTDTATPAVADAAPILVAGISVDNDKLILYSGNPATKLTATVNPPDATNKTVTWHSSNPEVATVDGEGMVTPLKPGFVMVSVTTQDGGIAFDITVEVRESVPLTALSLNKTTYSMATGIGSLQLKASLVPANATNKQEVVWSSDSVLVATVDKTGTVVARSPGKARITAKTADGKLQAFCIVTVSKDYVPVNSVALNKPVANLIAGSPSQQLVATIKPANATYKDVVWTSSDSSVVSVDQRGFLQVLNGGAVTITATTVDGKKTATAEVNASLFVTGSKVKIDKEVLDLTLLRDIEGPIAALHVNTEAEIKRKVHGDSAELKATVEPDTGAPANVSWKTSNDQVAIVSSEGMVTPIGVGTAVITATAEDGGSAISIVRVTMAAPDAKMSLKTALSGSTSVTFGTDLDSGNSALVNNSDIKLEVSLTSSGEAEPQSDDQIRGEIRIYSKGDLYKLATSSIWDMEKEKGIGDNYLAIDYAKIVFGQYGFLSVTRPETQLNYAVSPELAFNFVPGDTAKRYGKLTPKSGYFNTIPNVADEQGTNVTNGLAFGVGYPSIAFLQADFGSIDKWDAGETLATNTAEVEKTNWGYRIQLAQDFLKDLTLELGYSSGILINDKKPNIQTAWGGKVGYRFGLFDQFFLKPNVGITMIGVENTSKIITSYQPALAGGLLFGWGEKADSIDIWGAKYQYDEKGSYPGLAVGTRYVVKALTNTPKDLVSLNVSLNTGALLGPVTAVGAFEIKDLNADAKLLEYGYTFGVLANLRFSNTLISPRTLLTHKESSDFTKTYTFFKAGLDVDGLIPFVLIGVDYQSNDLLNGFNLAADEKQGKFEATVKVKF